MNIYRLDKGTEVPRLSPALALGNFDGVHIAHRRLIEAAKNNPAGAPAGVLSFTGDTICRSYITNEEERLGLFEKAGVDAVFLCDFGRLRSVGYDAFFNEVLIDRLGAAFLYCGFNYTFGYMARGSVADLVRLSEAANISCTVIPEVKLSGVTVSSSAVRAALSAGDVGCAAALLGRAFSVTGVISHGKALASRLGFPTINLPCERGRTPVRYGVYFTRCTVGGVVYPALTNVGIRPTFGGGEPVTESYLIGASGNYYGERVCVEFLGFHRDERMFDSEAALTAAVREDMDAAVRFFGLQPSGRAE